MPALQNPEIVSKWVESVVTTHYRRQFPTYYLKGEVEVDVAYVEGKRFYPIEVKWAKQLHPKDLKQIFKYNNAIILNKNMQPGEINGIKTVPLPLALFNFDC